MTSPLLYGRVEDWIGGLVVDGLDSDDLPDDVDLTGTATFEPVLTDEKGGIRVPGMVPRPKWLNVQAVTATYANGRLTHRGLPYVMLLSPASEINPTNWKWKVSFALKLNGSSINRTSFAFVLPPYDPAAVPANPGGLNPTVVNLVTVQPIAVPGPGTGVVQGPRGFGVVDVEAVDEGGVSALQFKVASESGPVPIGDPIEIPGGGGSVSDESLAELAGDPATATGAAIGERVLEVGDVRYAQLGSTATVESDGTGGYVLVIGGSGGGTTPPPSPPAQITGVQVTPSVTAASVAWNPDSAATNYYVEHRAAGGSTWTRVEDDASPAALTGLPAGSREFRVAGVGTGGVGSYSAVVTATIAAAATVPSKITGVQVTPGNKAATISWTADAAASGNIVYHRVTGAGSWTEVVDNASPLVLDTLPNGSHDFAVAGTSTAGTGTMSDVVTVTLGAVNGVVVTDSYTRSASDIVGTSPASGPGAYSGATGQLSVDGTQALAFASPSGSPLYLPIGARGEVSMSYRARLSTQETVSKALRSYLYFADAANTLYVELSSVGTNQTGQVKLVKRIGNTVTTMTTLAASALPANTAAAFYAIAASRIGLTFSVTANGVTASSALTQAEVDALTGGTAQVAFTVNSANHAIDDLSVSVNGLYV